VGIFNRFFGSEEKDEESDDETPSAEGTPPPNDDEDTRDLGDGSEDMKKANDEDQTAVDTPSKMLLSKSPRLAGGVRLATPRSETQPDKRKPSAARKPPPAPQPKPMRAARATTERSAAPPASTGRSRGGLTLGNAPSRPPPPLPPPPGADTEPTPKVSPKKARRARTAKDQVPRQVPDSISGAFERIQLGDNETTNPDAKPGISTDSDREAVQGVFDELAKNHVDQVRNVMLELQIGDVACSWIDGTKASLSSLRAMAEQMELTDLCEALDAFTKVIGEAVASGNARVEGDNKDALIKRYEKLIELIPTAFALEGERDTREPIIVESLLLQVSGVEKLTIDKLFAAGVSRLNALTASNATDLAAVSGIDREVAERIAARFANYKDSVPTAVAARDANAERKELRKLLAELQQHQASYEKAAAGWSAEDRQRKRAARKQREQAFLQARVLLARLGEADRLKQMEKRPFNQRIADIDKYLEDNARLRPPSSGGAQKR